MFSDASPAPAEMGGMKAFRLVSAMMIGAALAGPALAQSAPAKPAAPAAPATTVSPDGSTLSLSDDQKDALLAGHTEDSVDAARAGLPGGAPPRPGIHGEVGAMVGSHGTRAVYGTAAVPLGDHAGAVVSFEKGRYGYPY
jgi:hypothetical protein